MPIISPIQPTSAHNMMPATPIEHIDKNTPAPTPTDQTDSKSNNASPFMSAAPASVEAPLSVEQATKQRLETTVATPGDADSNAGGTGGHAKSSSLNTSSDTCNANGGAAPMSAVNNISNELKQILSLLKRPTLTSRDYEDIELEDDGLSRNTLYDYSTLDAWMNHPVKRHRPNEDVKPKRFKQLGHLYSAFENRSVAGARQSNAAESYNDGDQSMRSINSEQNADDNYGDVMEPHEIKREPGETDADGKATNNDNLFTSKGLVASFKDLDQIFDSTENSPLGVSGFGCCECCWIRYT